MHNVKQRYQLTHCLSTFCTVGVSGLTNWKPVMFVPPYLNSSKSIVCRSYINNRQELRRSITARQIACIWKSAHQRRDQIAVIVAHHSNLLSLFQNVVYFFRRTIQHDVRFRRIFDLLQQRPVTREHDRFPINVYDIEERDK